MIHGHGLSIILSNDIDNGYHLGIVMSASNDVNVARSGRGMVS